MRSLKKLFSISYIFTYSKTFTLAIIILLPILLLGLVPELVTSRNPLKTGYATGLTPPSSEFPMGTDQLGRDVLSWTLYGIRVAFLVGLASTFIALVIAIAIGLPSGYYGGYIDDILMRVTDFFLSIPRFILIIFAVILFGSSLTNIILIIGVFSWPSLARIIRGEVLSVKEREYVKAAKSLGSTTLDIIFDEIFPNVLPPLVTASALQMSDAILIEAGLSFLGLGDPTVASWGRILSIARQAILAGGWWTLLYPSIFISLTILGINLLSDGLNDIFNPKLR